MDEITSFVDELKIDVLGYDIDHAALRIRTDEEVLRLHDEIAAEAEKLSESEIKGRKIYIFKLHEPLTYKDRTISCVELPHPAEGHNYPRNGWEHVEFVLPKADPDSLHSAFKTLFPHLTDDDYKKYNYKVTTPKVEGEQLMNTTASLSKYRGLSVKFHCYPIEEIVRSK